MPSNPNLIVRFTGVDRAAAFATGLKRLADELAEPSQMFAQTIADACDGDRHKYEARAMHTERDTARAMLILTPAGEVTL